MRKTELMPTFHITLGELAQLGDKALQLIDQDQSVLASYGVNDDYKTYIETKTQELKDCSTDEELGGLVANLTEIKDNLAKILKVSIRSIMVRVKPVFREDSSKWGRFGTAGLDKMTDLELAKCGYRVAQMATEFLTDLALTGITQTMIDELQADTKKFDNAIDFQQYNMRLRVSTTHDRLLHANDLYLKIVLLFDFGKDYWSSHDASRCKDYIIYDTPAETPIKEESTGKDEEIEIKNEE